jgi:hypothetical protein
MHKKDIVWELFEVQPKNHFLPMPSVALSKDYDSMSYLLHGRDLDRIVP